MDKNNKNRTDLLAAGRKKLQQFRQKKDGKEGKYSGKAGKHGHDGGADASTTATSEKVLDKEASVSDTGDVVTSSELYPAKDSLVAGNYVASVDQSGEDGIRESITAIADEKLGVDISWRVSKHDDDVKLSVLLLEGGGASDIHEDVELGNSGSSDNVISKEKFTPSDMLVPVDLSSQGDSGREEQVTDVGTMQEVGSSGSKQTDGSSEIRIERLVSDDGKMVDVKEVTNEAARKDQSDDASLTAITGNVEEASKRGVYTVPSEPLAELEQLSIASAELQVDEINDAYCSSSEGVQADKSGKKDVVEGSFAYENAGLARSLGSNIMKFPFAPNPCSTSLSQLAEIIKGLDEDEFRFLCSSRESSIENLKTTPFLDAEFNYLELLKEQLYLTSFAKDVSEMQLYEHLELEMQSGRQIQKLVDEISVTSDSLSEVQGKNEILSAELADCRSELRDFRSGREELQKQLQGSQAELAEFSVKVDGLQNKLEKSGGELARLVSELAQSRNSFVALQVEYESLNGRVSLLMEEKMALIEDKDYFLKENEKMAVDLAHYKALSESVQSENVNLTEYLASVKEENRKFVEDNEYLVRANSKLLSDLADCNVKVEALRAEITELSGLLASAKEEKKKLEEAQAKFVLENEKLALDLVNTRSSIDAIQTEMSNLNESMTSLMEEKNKLEDEKQYLLSKNESGLHELADCKAVVADLQADFFKAMADLKEAGLHIEQLIQENVLLKTNLELHIAEISNSDAFVGPFEDSGRMNLVNVDSSSLTPSPEVSEIAISMSLKASSKSTTDGPQPAQFVLDCSNDPSSFECWKLHLKEASEVLQKLENAVDAMQSLSASLRSSAKQVAPGVSKLIQAFETKSHTDDNQIPEMHLAEKPPPVDPYMLAKEQTKKLQVVFKQMLLWAQNAYIYFEGERKNGLSIEVLNAKLKACCEFWESHVNNLEEENIELLFLCEALKQHICNSEESVKELLVSYKDLQKHEVALDAENSQLKVKLTNFQEKVTEFQGHLDEICQGSEQMVYSMHSKVETLLKGNGDLGSILEVDWKTFVTWIVQKVGKLDMCVETIFSLLTDREYIGHVGSVVASSFDAATKVIEGLQGQLQVTQGDHHSVSSNYTELNMQFNILQTNNAVLVDILDKIYTELRRVVESSGQAVGTEPVSANEKLVDPLDPDVIYDVLDKLHNLLDKKLQLLSDNEKLNSDMMDRVREIDELKRRCFHLDAILKLFENVGEEFMLDSSNINPIDPVSGLESFINTLLQKYKKTMEQVRLFKEKPTVNGIRFNDFNGELDHLILLLVHYENENLVLKESWRTAIKDIPALQAELLEKVAELEQSEHRVSSLREKLGIAVSKGKGLIVQRDSLKQSLAQTSNQLEKYSQELQLKDVRIFELEAKQKSYSEAGERMEALKSELAYIRNSATALRESFLLKDSVIQRIEEILEDLELPEHFHSRDIIEKIDWLAKSITGSASVVDWDQKSNAGGSYSESGFTGMDGWREETQPIQDSADDFERRYEELQSKFYGLAEHNEMLEQSLMERNNLVRHWEEILGKIEVPSQLSSLDPEVKIQWLGGALSDFQNQCHSLQQRIDYLDTLRGLLTGDLEESRIRISELESACHSVISEKEFLMKKLETVTNDYDEFSKKTSLLETENENLLKEITSLRKQLDQKLIDEEHAHHVEAEIRRLQGLISDVLQDSVTDGPEFASDNMESLEHLLKKLIEKYRTLLTGAYANSGTNDLLLNENDGLTQEEEKIRDSGDSKEDDCSLSKRLEDALGELMYLKEEKDRFSKNNQSMALEIESLDAKKSELQELLNHEEQKSASLREKLNIAVKKGKSLVQQRDNLKQLNDEANAEADCLKSEVTLRENSIIDFQNKVANLSISLERTKGIEADCAFLRDRLSDTEHFLEEKEHILNRMVEYLKDFEVEFDLGSGNPCEKLEAFGKYFQDLHVALDSSEQESRKSKRAAELLVVELNEVQERNDTLQDDLVKVATELSELSKEKKLCEAEKSEALANLEKVSAVRLEERDHLWSEVSMLKSGVDQHQIDISAIDRSLAVVLSKDLEILHSLDASIKSCLESTSIPSMATMPVAGAFYGLNFPKLESKIFMTEVGSLKERLQRHYHLLHEEASHIFETVMTVHTQVVSLKESFEAKDRELMQLKSTVNDKDCELFVMQKNISLLHEACNISIAEIENWKTQQSEIGFPDEAPIISLNSQTIVGKDASLIVSHPYSEENIMTLRDKLLSMVNDLLTLQNANLEGSQKEMKTLILNLQKELHEKDIQRDRICSEFMSQIKEAEAKAMTHLQDLQATKTQANNLQGQLSVMEEERAILETRIKELEDREAMCLELTQRVTSLTDSLAAKDQEIEALMQALDEEESQMEGLSNKILELEKDLLEKNQDLKNLEASRGKALKKLSVTVNKFDELHNLSETLLSEVEKLQSQLRERDEEISFLRQEVTRCTNEVLSVTQMNKKRNFDEVLEVLSFLDTMVSQVQVSDMSFSDAETNEVGGYEVKLQKKISFILSELEKLQAVVQDRDLLLVAERSRVEELMRKEQFLENSLHEKESQLTMLRHLADSGQATSSSSEIVEVDPLINKRAALGNIAPQVRGGRKMNNDHVAIAIDMDPTSSTVDDDDDKAHGFKSLTTSAIVPRFTRPVSDMIDGLWMSCDRALMRQPTLRLGVIIYWAIMHTLLTAFVV